MLKFLHSNKFLAKMGLPNAPRSPSAMRVQASFSSGCPDMSERLGLSELVFICGGHVVRDKIESLGCCLPKNQVT